ncbi:unnamed protein product, partial [marine sediment metagenome]
MSYSNTISKGKAFALLGAVSIGFFLADMAILVWRAPGLLQPSHWSGLGALLVSGLVLYATIGLGFLGFYVMLRIMFRLLRLKFTPIATALITVFSAPLFLVAQYSLQKKMLGRYISLKSTFFYVPTGIIMGVLVVVLLLIYFVKNRLGEPPLGLRRAFTWTGLIGTSCVIFILYALLAGSRINVLGMFTDKDQRALNKQNEPATMQRTTAE